MIKKLHLILLLVLTSMTMVAQDWIEVNSGLPTGKGIGQISVGMNDADALWALPINTDGTIYDAFTRSTDGGLTWTVGAFNAGTGLSMLFAIDANTCWAVFNTGANQGLYKTTDGGTTWVKKGGVYNASSFANVIHFFNDNDGFAQGDPVGGYYELYTTTDGGEVWTRVPQANIPAPTAGEYGITGNYSAFGNSIWMGTNFGRVFYSSDKGYTWQATLTPFGATNVVQPLFKNETTGIAFRSYLDLGLEPELNVTIDGGATWSTLSVFGNMRARWFDYIPGTAGILLGSSSAVGFEGIGYSTNDGATWTELTVGVPVQAPKFIDNQTGWAGTWVVDNAGGILIYNGDPIGGGSSIIFEDDFDSYTNGAYVAVSIPEFFTTWTNAPGTAEDAKFSTELAETAPNSVKVDGTTDLIMKLGNKTSGKYAISWDMNVPVGFGGYYNFQHMEAPGNEYAVEVYFDNNGTGYMHAGGQNTATFTFTNGAWFSVNNVIDIDNDWAQIYFNDVLIYEWQYSLQSDGTAGTNQLGGIDFYAGATAGMTPMYYFDNIVFEALVEGSQDPSIGVVSTAIITTIEEGNTYQQNLPITNVGEGTLVFNITKSFDMPTATNQPNLIPAGTIGKVNAEFAVDETPFIGDAAPLNRDVTLNYDGENSSGVGMTAGAQWRAAVRFPSSMVVPYNGMYLSSVMIYINDPANAHKLQVYDMGSINVPGPGAMLHEQTFEPLPGWNTIVLTTPVYVGGRDLWVGYWMDQPAGLFPAGVDAGPAVADGRWISTGPGWNFLSLDYNWNIRAMLTGTAGSVWLSATPTSGELAAGETADVSVNVNAAGLAPLTVYKGKLHIRSNDYAAERINISVFITVLVGVNENGEQAYISMYPNPAHTTFTLKANTNIQTVTITNNLGQIVYSGNVDQLETQIRVSDYKAGMYIVRMETENGTAIQKLMVE